MASIRVGWWPRLGLLMNSPCNPLSVQSIEGAGVLTEYVAGVTRELAEQRRQQISHLRYDLELSLDAGLTRLDGRIRIRLRLADGPYANAPVVLDFRDLADDGQTIDGLIAHLTVNGRSVGNHHQLNGHLILPTDNFLTGENEISLEFRSTVATAGRPLLRFEDHQVGERYVYLLSVPMDASLAYPCFDQPDLKGSFSLTITMPAGMTAVSNTATYDRTMVDDDRVRYRFAPTLPLSTYLFSFAVGPFAKIESEFDGHPIRLFVRQSQLLGAEIEWPAILNLTTAGIRYLSAYLEYEFPFGKYDQVLLPGFPFRGMEHAGATFLREEAVLLPTDASRGEQLSRAVLILHELAHQWFGDLVTMRWFDDLWIKEGFANLLAYQAMAAIQPYGLTEREVWKCFHLAHRPGATTIDRTAGTTPIHQQITNLRDAKSAYGAIVYQKAPIILRSLSFILGPEIFQAGVRRFLRRHAFDVADWGDLIRSLEEVSGQTLQQWAEAWIIGSGMPTVETEWKLAGSVTDPSGQRLSIRLTQRDARGNSRHWPIDTLVRVALADGSVCSRRTSFGGGSSRLIELNVSGKPRFIFANDEDRSYGSFLPDERSLEALVTEVDRTIDPLDRLLYRGAIDDAFAAGRLDPNYYLDILRRSIGSERDEDQLTWLLERLIQISERHVKTEATSSGLNTTERLLLTRMAEGSTPGEQLLLLRVFRRLAVTSEALSHLKGILTQGGQVAGVRLPPGDRWATIASLLAHGDSEADELLERERLADRSGSSAKLAWISAAARPDPAVKDRYFDEYLRVGGVPEDWIVESLTTFNNRHQTELTIGYLLPALRALPRLKRERKIFFILAWLNAFIGGHPAERALPVVDDFLRQCQLDRDLSAKILQVADCLRHPSG